MEVERKRRQACHQVLWPELLHWTRWCILCYAENVKITSRSRLETFANRAAHPLSKFIILIYSFPK